MRCRIKLNSYLFHHIVSIFLAHDSVELDHKVSSLPQELEAIHYN